MNRWWQTAPPEAELQQDYRHLTGSDDPRLSRGNRRSAPEEMPFIEYDPFGRQWHQGARVLPHFKPNYYFTRPKDGKRSGWVGRMKDVMTGEGADVFITSSGDKRTLMRDRPRRWHWAGWRPDAAELDALVMDKDRRWQDFTPVIDHKFSRARADKPFYNFRNREYESAGRVARHPGAVWTCAVWPQNARDGEPPWCYRDVSAQWFTRVPWWNGAFPGGRPSGM
ncbi:hypothetical protein M433DRAFT_70031 [Acidomyces richmondensis BFW]|nr:MAG: hypothetical protein FE78DRAFT_354819 [Acidomyces sp. 'richmondensis']KYG44175.1 hypothetical protein M433DRAFT_70031 [Acidomyces richmondensis BFW]